MDKVADPKKASFIWRFWSQRSAELAVMWHKGAVKPEKGKKSQWKLQEISFEVDFDNLSTKDNLALCCEIPVHGWRLSAESLETQVH